jgi:hypothetical protein
MPSFVKYRVFLSAQGRWKGHHVTGQIRAPEKGKSEFCGFPAFNRENPGALAHPKNASRPEREAEILRDCARQLGYT